MKRFILLIFIILIFLTGFTIVDYQDYKEPSWVWRDTDYTDTPGVALIKDKTEEALRNTESKGLKLKPFTIHISPFKYHGGHVKGMASKKHLEIVLADYKYETIYHEIGHIYEYQNKGLLEKYAKDMKKYYPNIEIEAPEFEPWKKKISEDFAEEFRLIFTGGEKRTLYPPFPNFYEWLLRNTQQVEVTREEAFDKLGGTKELIDQGIVIGNPEGDFMLDKTLTRAELATVLVRIKGFNKEKKVPFTDIKNKWYEPYVRKIYNEGLIKGYPDNTFGGNNKITRYELHLILERLNTQK